MATLSCPYCPVPKNFIPSDINYILCKFHLHQTDKEVGCYCKYCVSKKLADNDIPPCRSLNIIKYLQTQSYKKDVRKEHIEEHTKEEHNEIYNKKEDNEIYNKKEDNEIYNKKEEIESLSSGLEIINMNQLDEYSKDNTSDRSENISSKNTSNRSEEGIGSDSTDNEIVFVQSPMESFINLNYIDD
jgi:hypothetical protein